VKQRFRARFRLVTVIQVILLAASTTVLAWSAFTTDYLAVPAVLVVIIALQVLALLRFVESHVDTLEEFFAAINYEDFTRRFAADDIDAELKVAFNRILDRFQDARAQRDLQASYLETVVRHVPVPFIASRSDGSLSLVNNPARRLTGITNLRKLDDLAELDPELPKRMRSIEPGQQQLLQTRLREVPVELRVSVSEIRMEGEAERLYSVENLSGELTARESSAWRNLIRVLTHEIMNTLTPVTSLAQTCEGMLDEAGATADIREAVSAIARRSAGLMDFVSRYRELLQVPQPQPVELNVLAQLTGIVSLLREQLGGIEIAVDVVPETLEVYADQSLLDQALLNLVKNAINALTDSAQPKIDLRARLDYGRVLIQVADNGPGIPENIRDQIFIPFFTTRRDGSGIGLSLSRQIMTAHDGEIAVTDTGHGCTVSLVF